MTNWTDVNDTTTPFRKYSGGDRLTTQDGKGLQTQDGFDLVEQGIESGFVDVSDKDTLWGAFGGLIRLVTEGYRENLMSEGNLDYLVYSHGEDLEIWTDTADTETTYTKINDV